MDVHLDIQYAQDSDRSHAHKFDLYLPSSPPFDPSNSPLVCFVHGGAWRSEDKKDHAWLAEKIVIETKWPVAVPNYRLTPQNKIEDANLLHPSHAEDILQFLEFLMSWDNPSGLDRVFQPKMLFLMGHSCGAHMLSSIFLDSSKVIPSLAPSPTLLNAVRGIVVSEGIYNLDLLISHFPAYLDWFIIPAFGNLTSYAPFAVTNYRLRRPGVRWLIIQSKGDTLVDTPQSEMMLDHLKSEYGESAENCIFYSTSLTQEHDDILKTDEFVKIVVQFLENVFKEDDVSFHVSCTLQYSDDTT